MIVETAAAAMIDVPTLGRIAYRLDREGSQSVAP